MRLHLSAVVVVLEIHFRFAGLSTPSAISSHWWLVLEGVAVVVLEAYLM